MPHHCYRKVHPGTVRKPFPRAEARRQLNNRTPSASGGAPTHCFEISHTLIFRFHYGIFTEDARGLMCDIAVAIKWWLFFKEIEMSHSELDSVVKTTAANIGEKDIEAVSIQADAEIEDECWNRNRPLNMIAYEDQR